MNIEKLAETNNLSKLETEVFQYILDNIDECSNMGVREIARNNFTSTTTIIRISKKLGYDGFREMIYDLKNHSKLGTVKRYDIFKDEYIKQIISNENIDSDIKKFIKLVFSNKRVLVYGNGFSKSISEYIYKKLTVRGIQCIFTSESDGLGVFKRYADVSDIMLIVSKSGQTLDMINKVVMVKSKGVKVVSFTTESNNDLDKLSDVAIKIKGENILDDENKEPTLFFGYCLIIFEYIVKNTIID